MLKEQKIKDFVELVQLLSKKSSLDNGTGHKVTVWTPMGRMKFLMYPNKLSMKMKSVTNRDSENECTKWASLKVKFIAVTPVERW